MKKKSRVHPSQLRPATRVLTAAELDRIEKIRASVERDRAQIMATLDELAERHERRSVVIAEAMSLLKESRQKQGMTLDDLSHKTGIAKGALSRLESGADPNPTIRTLQRVAGALGKTVLVGLADTSS